MIISRNCTKYFSLYSNCIPVKGFKRSIIYDLQNKRWDFIPNGLMQILSEFINKRISDCYKVVDESQHNVLDDYFSFLIEKDYLLLANTKRELKSFSKVDLTFAIPNIISNAILDFDSKTLSKRNYGFYQNFFEDLYKLGCRNFQIRVYGNKRIKLLETLVSNLNDMDVEIDMLYPYIAEFNITHYEDLFIKIANLRSLTIHSTPTKNIDYFESSKYSIAMTALELSDNTCCGNIRSEYFTVNFPLFTESLAYNNCLNKKVGVDVLGNIKNCPSMNTSFSNIGDSNIYEILLSKEFQEPWSISKDMIQTCKICEFRYMCTDCRAFLTDKFAQPKKCSYDPILAKWIA